ncbi:hypothetical protein GGI11_008474, partial [Coemansia sp. RSA 2049]
RLLNPLARCLIDGSIRGSEAVRVRVEGEGSGVRELVVVRNHEPSLDAGAADGADDAAADAEYTDLPGDASDEQRK